ncbi:MAG TPA: MMPL family transporter, partial [Ktedonobacteraceae bacterium]|nr:MMPL family transporter [Ktedonobacteraceae bacterium]
MQIQEKPQDSLEKGEKLKKISTLESHGLYRLGLAYGRQVYRFRWFIIALWIIIVAVSIPFASQISSALQGGGYSFKDSESIRVDNLLTSKFHQPLTQALVIFQSTNSPVSNPAYQHEVQDFMAKARAFPNVTQVTQGGTGQDGRTTYVMVNFNQTEDKVETKVADFHKLLPTSGPAKAYLTGDPAIFREITTTTQQDVEHAEIAALPIALLVLLVVFGTLIAAAMPILLAVVAVPVALAVVYAIALHYSMSIFVLNIASIIGLGISIDYSLFMVRRFRDELAEGRSAQDAVGWTIATAGEAILFSGLIVMIGFSGLLLIGVPIMISMGIGGAVVVGVAVLAALTLLPSLLGVLGPRINSLRIPFFNRFTMRTEQRAASANMEKKPRGFWELWAWGVMRRPVLIIVAVSALLLLLSWPIFSISIGTAGASSLPKGAESRQGIDILNAQFPATNQYPIFITAQTTGGSSMLTAENLAKLDNLTKWIAAQDHVTGVISLTHLPSTPGAPALSEQQLATLYSTGAYQQNPAMAQLVSSTTNGDTTLITVKSDTKIDSSEGKALIDNLRAGDQAAGQGLKVQVGGFQAISLDFNRYLYNNFPKAIAFILIATYILLLLMFRSVVLPLKAILMNVLSVCASYGVLVFIFQWGNFSNILNFTADGYLNSILPILLFCILFGLSMDYEVFLLSRIREEWLLTHNNRWAVARGLAKTGGVITNAALLFVIVCGAFTFTSVIITKEMGL